MRLDIYHNNTIALAKKTFHTTVNSFELSHDSFHAIYVDAISSIVAQSNGASKQKRDLLREDLSTLLIDFYNATSLNALAGLTFVDKEGSVLLRMHQPHIYDDNVEELRHSFKNMAQSFLYKKGLEIGVYQKAYRYQYPLFYDGVYVGAYEYSVHFEYILREMQKIYANKYMLLLHETNSRVGSFEKDRLQYMIQEGFFDTLVSQKDAVIFDYSYEGSCYSLVTCPLRDINEKRVGTILVDVKKSPRDRYRQDFIIEMSFALFLGFLVFVFSYKKKQHNQYVRELLNIQNQMLIVTNGTQLIDANDTFFKFFGYKNLKEFTYEHDCVCDFFIEDEGCLGKFTDGLLWTEYIQKYTKKKHCVKILDKNLGKKKVFELEWVLFEKTSNLFVSFRDITEELHEKQALENRANYDNLTGLYNRERFNYFLEKYMRDARQEKRYFSLIMFDIDHFKKINDTLGHDVGDSVLKELASLISSQIREGDILARWGGEEFMIIAPLKLPHAHSFAQKLRRLVEEHSFEDIEALRCSFGVTEFSQSDTPSTLTKRADEMLYKAKNQGRNCVISS
jgi:diguanylate cyclase